MRQLNYTILLVLLLNSFNLFGQQEDTKISKPDLPNSIINLGIGVGSHYGLIGLKTVFGYKNSGLILGVGRFEELITTQIGAQLSFKVIYIAYSYGAVGVAETKNDKKLIIGNTIIAGGMIDLTKNKRLFLDLGMGLTFGKSKVEVGYLILEYSTSLSLITGLSYRIFNYSE